MKKSKDYRQYAYEKLRGNWVQAIIVGLIATILGGNIFGTGINMDLNINQTQQETILEFTDMISPEMRSVVLAALAILAVIAIFYFWVCFLIGGCIRIGNARFQLDLVSDKEIEIGTVFSGFRRFKTGLGLNFLTSLYILAWTLLFIIPGIVAAYKYAMAPFILAENPEMTAGAAITASKELMKGNKGRLFCLCFSFIGWMFVTIITLGLGNLLLIPYMEASFASFYCDIKEKEVN